MRFIPASRLIVRPAPLPLPNTELDDEIEQILARFVPDDFERLAALNRICGAITARGYNVFTRRPEPADRGATLTRATA